MKNSALNQKKLIQILNFQPKENTSGIFIKKYADGYTIEVDFEKDTFYFGGKIKIAEKYQKIEQIKKSISEELDKIANIEIDYE